MASPLPGKKTTNQFMRQGHTESEYGSNININAKGKAGATPKEVKP